MTGYNTSTGGRTSEVALSNNMSISSSLAVINGGALVLTTKDQPVYIKNSSFEGWLYNPKDLVAGDLILDASTNTWTPVTSLTFSNTPTQVYDLRVNGSRDFMANGYLLLDKPVFRGAPLAIKWVTDSRNLTEVGGTITFFASVYGGVNTTTTYSWSFGDGTPTVVLPNDTAQSVMVNHTYQVTGNFVVTLQVSNELGQSDSASLNVTVILPLAASVSASPPAVLIGQQTLLAATVSGGSGVYSITWLGLPSGCATVNATAISCKPSTAGTYPIRVMVVDSLNFGVQSAPLEFTVYLEEVNLVLTITGTPGNALNLTVLDNDNLMAWAQVVRTPGPPDSVSLVGLELQANHSYVIVVTLLQGAHGATPATLNISYEGSTSGYTLLSHAFNAQHHGTWIWRLDLNAIYAASRT